MDVRGATGLAAAAVTAGTTGLLGDDCCVGGADLTGSEITGTVGLAGTGRTGPAGLAGTTGVWDLAGGGTTGTTGLAGT